MLGQTHLFSGGLLFSDVSTLSKTKHEDSQAWEYRQFQRPVHENKQTEALGLSHSIELAVDASALRPPTFASLVTFFAGRS